MDDTSSAGVTPLSVGGAEYPAQQIFYELVLSKADRAFVDAYQRYTGKVDFTGSAFQFGATTFASWVRKGYIAKDFEWGTFLFPGNRLHPGSSGNLWVVPAKAKDKTLAYDFIDITMKPEIQRLLAEFAVPTGKNTDLHAHFATIEAADGLAFYPDWPAAGYYDVLGVAIQHLGR
ncbi:hypothetical protein [Actinoplanes philippinensis]|uniref:hypothetical protein n=1 Tax=Actinoplanes philippinensis TaxID=35752 RepID=UPI0033D5549C